MTLAELVSGALLLLLGANSIFLLILPSFAVWFSVLLFLLLLVLSFYDRMNIKMEEILMLTSVFPLLTCILIALRPQTLLLQSVIVYVSLLLLSFGYFLLFPRLIVGFTKKYLLYLPLLIVLGGLVGFAYATILPKIPQSPLSLSYALPLLFGVAIIEEVYFRGLLQTAVQSFGGKIMSVAYTFFLFVLFHMSSIPGYMIGMMVYTLIASLIYPSPIGLQINDQMGRV